MLSFVARTRSGRGKATFALGCEKIEVRATQTRLLYCDAQCFARHEKMATLVSERCARKVS